MATRLDSIRRDPTRLDPLTRPVLARPDPTWPDSGQADPTRPEPTRSNLSGVPRRRTVATWDDEQENEEEVDNQTDSDTSGQVSDSDCDASDKDSGCEPEGGSDELVARNQWDEALDKNGLVEVNGKIHVKARVDPARVGRAPPHPTRVEPIRFPRNPAATLEQIPANLIWKGRCRGAAG